MSCLLSSAPSCAVLHCLQQIRAWRDAVASPSFASRSFSEQSRQGEKSERSVRDCDVSSRPFPPHRQACRAQLPLDFSPHRSCLARVLFYRRVVRISEHPIQSVADALLVCHAGIFAAPVCGICRLFRHYFNVALVFHSPLIQQPLAAWQELFSIIFLPLNFLLAPTLAFVIFRSFAGIDGERKL
jgi:hypothetical protein